jgi:hypothetical protein
MFGTMAVERENIFVSSGWSVLESRLKLFDMCQKSEA